ncbi:hypothetical protein J3Q64DRAFT_1851067, partial [Phycomyces blakesleeanus]
FLSFFYVFICLCLVNYSSFSLSLIGSLTRWQQNKEIAQGWLVKYLYTYAYIHTPKKKPKIKRCDFL